MRGISARSTLCPCMKSFSVRCVTRALSWRIVLALGGAIAAGCATLVNGVSVEPGTAAHPRFVVTDSAGGSASGLIYGLSVVHCGTDSSAWTITSNGSQGSVAVVNYGVSPAGFASTRAPDSLRAGCYDVYVTDGRRARFRVDAAGRVTPERTRRVRPAPATDSTRRDDVR